MSPRLRWEFASAEEVGLIPSLQRTMLQQQTTSEVRSFLFPLQNRTDASNAAKNWNQDSWSQVRLRPRILRDVTNADLSTTMLGNKAALPIFIAPAAMGRLAHPEGEKLLVRVAASAGIPYIVRVAIGRRSSEG